MKQWIATVYLALVSSISVAQSPAVCFEAGLHASAVGSYDVAIRLIERAIWFDPSLRSLKSDISLSTAYAKTGDYLDATQVLDHRMAQAELDDSSRVELLIQYAWVSLLNDRLPEMKYWMLQADTAYGKSQRLNLAMMQGSAYFLNGEFDEARNHLILLPNLQSVEEQRALDEILAKARKYHKKKPTAAMLMSIFLPGLGQLYAKEPREALNTVLLNAATVSLYLLTLTNYGYIEATILVYPWFLRYYKGGYDRARELVRKRKSRELIDGLEGIVELSQGIKKGAEAPLND